MNETRDIYMIQVNEVSGSVFVKTYDYFKSQGGFTEEWGTHWKPVVATSIEHARFIGCREPNARPKRYLEMGNSLEGLEEETEE